MVFSGVLLALWRWSPNELFGLTRTVDTRLRWDHAVELGHNVAMWRRRAFRLRRGIPEIRLLD